MENIDFDNIDLEGYDPSRFDLSESVVLDLTGRDQNEIELDFEEIDYGEIEEGCEVIHEFLGDGVIESFSEDRKQISVRFEEEAITFLFPDAFEEEYLKIRKRVD